MRSCDIASRAAPALRGLLRVALTIAVGGNSGPIKLAAHLIKSLVLVSDDLHLLLSLTMTRWAKQSRYFAII